MCVRTRRNKKMAKTFVDMYSFRFYLFTYFNFGQLLAATRAISLADFVACDHENQLFEGMLGFREQKDDSPIRRGCGSL